jgi:hypothetical protein
MKPEHDEFFRELDMLVRLEMACGSMKGSFDNMPKPDEGKN